MSNENKNLTQVEIAEELKALAKENGVELTDEQTAEILAKLKSGELSEDELNAVSGGVSRSAVEGLCKGIEALSNKFGGSISSTISEKIRNISEDLLGK